MLLLMIPKNENLYLVELEEGKSLRLIESSKAEGAWAKSISGHG